MAPETSRLLTEAAARLDAGDLAGASTQYRDILQQQPQQPQALMMLGLIARQMGRMELALQLLETAKSVAPDTAAIWINYAVILRQLERRTEARHAAETALQLDPQSPEALDTAGYMAREDGAVELACERHGQATKLAPKNARLHANYASALLRTMQLSAAYAEAKIALQLDPQLPLAHMTLASILRAAGYPARALPHFQQAYALQPDYIDAYSNEAQARLLIGDWAAGWAVFEHRLQDKKRFATLPRWQGAKIDHLLVHAEQGFGDTIQFMRWLPLLAEHVGKVTLQAPLALHRLIANTLPNISLITPAEDLPVADAHLPMMSLPFMLGTKIETVPAILPITVPKAEQEKWRMQLQSMPWLRVGLIWRGNPLHPNDHNRSITQAMVEPLLARFGEHCVVVREAMVQMSVKETKLEDFSDTAALLAELDLVIAVDTSVAHLAGTMGRPTWLLVPFDPDWRWFYEREDSIWYPSMRLFRQEQPQDWTNVIARVIAELQKLQAGDQQVLMPEKWLKSLASEHPAAVKLPLG